MANDFPTRGARQRVKRVRPHTAHREGNHTDGSQKRNDFPTGLQRRAPQTQLMFSGIWFPHSAEFAGNEIPLHGTRLTIEGDRYGIETPDGKDAGTLVFNTAVVPHQIDIIGTDGPNSGRTILAIGRREADQLTICYDVGGGPRPSEFTAPEASTRLLVVYRPSPA